MNDMNSEKHVLHTSHLGEICLLFREDVREKLSRLALKDPKN
jgi:hypothetical protein